MLQFVEVSLECEIVDRLTIVGTYFVHAVCIQPEGAKSRHESA